MFVKIPTVISFHPEIVLILIFFSFSFRLSFAMLCFTWRSSKKILDHFSPSFYNQEMVMFDTDSILIRLTMQKKHQHVNPSSIYSCSIGLIFKHEFCHLGCWAVSEKFLKRRNFCLSMQLFGVIFSCFDSQRVNLLIFFLHYRVRTKKLLNKKS